MTDAAWIALIFGAAISIAELGRLCAPYPYFNPHHVVTLILVIEFIGMEAVVLT